MYSDNRRVTHSAPISGGSKLVNPEKSRTWGLMSAGVFHRAPGEVTWLSDDYRISQPLTEIAQQVGFADQSHLTSIFRRETGMTPGRYRAALA